jgi:hypothetical protein
LVVGTDVGDVGHLALYRYFRHKQTYKYLDVLQDFARIYNRRTHRSLGQNSPAEVNQDNASEVRNIASKTYHRYSRLQNLVFGIPVFPRVGIDDE